MINEDKVFIWLSMFNFLTHKKLNALLEIFDNYNGLWKNFSSTNVKVKELLTSGEISQMVFSKDDKFIKTYVDNCKLQNIEIITMANDSYPKLLKETDMPPLLLYCKGDVSLLNANCIAIVGTRRPSRYGKDTTVQFASALSRSGLCIVSGLADGIDTEAHRAALDSGGKTIAVLGSGLNEIYPQANVGLAREIEKTGLLVSEYKPNEKPQTYYFPARNRIIAGLSKAVLITEAGEKSGSMHTKNYALDYNRNLFAVPARITDKTARGTNLIIKNLQASIVLEPQDILTHYGLSEKQLEKKTIQLDLNDEIVLSLFTSGEEIHYDKLLLASTLEPKVLNTTLTRLEIKGLVKKLAGNFYCI